MRGAGPRRRAVGSFLSAAHGPYPRETSGTVILASLKVATPFPEAHSLGCIRVWGSRGTVYIGGEATYRATETNLQTHVGSSSEAAKLCHIHNVLCDCWLPVLSVPAAAAKCPRLGAQKHRVSLLAARRAVQGQGTSMACLGRALSHAVGGVFSLCPPGGRGEGSLWGPF